MQPRQDAQISQLPMLVPQQPMASWLGDGVSPQTSDHEHLADPAHRSARHLESYTGSLTRAVAIASAGIMLPLVSEEAAYSYAAQGYLADSTLVPSMQINPSSQVSQAAMPSTLPLIPEVKPTAQPAFSRSLQSTEVRNAADPESLITQAEDGSWRLSYQGQSYQGQSYQGQSYQPHIDLAQPNLIQPSPIQTYQRPANSAQSLGGPSFAPSVDPLNAVAYRKSITDRISAVTEQKSQVLADMATTQRSISHLQRQFESVSAGQNIAQQVLAQDTTYQAVWQRLQQIEQKIASVFAQATVSDAVLQALLADYQHHQRWLEQVALEAADRYLSNQSQGVLGLKDLVMATHHYQVQQLRKTSLAHIEQQLLNHLKQYDQLQEETFLTQARAAQSQRTQDRVTASTANDTASTANSAVANKIRLSVALGAGALAIITATQRATQKIKQQSKNKAHRESSIQSQRRLEASSFDQSTFETDWENLQLENFSSQIDPAQVRASAQLHNELLQELIDVVGEPVVATRDICQETPQEQDPMDTHEIFNEGTSTDDTLSNDILSDDTLSDDTLNIELMVSELAELLRSATSVADLVEADNGAIASLRLLTAGPAEGPVEGPAELKVEAIQAA